MANDPLNIAAANAALSKSMFANKLHYFPEIGSTNSHALAEANNGAPSGTVYTADEQTAGRGRGAHAWHSPAGYGLYVSVLVRPNLSPRDALWLSLAAGLAVHRAVKETTGLAADIRWPNDLLLTESGVQKKFCGILTELSADATTVRHAVIGIGINVHHESFPPELSALATSLTLASGRPQYRQPLLIALLRSLEDEIHALETSRPIGSDILARIPEASSWVRGKEVTVTEHGDEPTAANSFSGVTAGLDSRGFLLVETSAGTRTVLSGGVRAALPASGAKL
jgi:BirA family transcriptional regulator, biotin operon repressor / biotin---[acetyl-CoA-carboxylase] ligase